MEKSKEEIWDEITDDLDFDFPVGMKGLAVLAMERYHTQFTQQGEQMTGMKGWRKYNDLPKEAGLYVCECQKKGNGETSQTVTYGQYIKGFPQIKVDEEKFGKVTLWLDESSCNGFEHGEQIVYVERAVKCLADLVQLKNYKEAYGKTAEYEKQQPILWEDAREIIHKLFPL